MDDDGAWFKRRGPLAGVMTVVIAALVAGGVMLVHRHSDNDRLAVGASRQGDYSMGGGYFSGTYGFEVPGAKISVNLETGNRGSKLDDTTYKSTRIKAPRDGLLVHLDWFATSTGGVATKYIGAHEVTSDEPAGTYTGGHRTKLSVRSKGNPVTVDPAIVPKPGYGSGGSADDDSNEKVVAVRGALADLELVITFQGRTQSVTLVNGRRVMGDFASLYDATGSKSRPVSIERDEPGDAGAAGAVLRSNCDVLLGGMFRTPYLDGLGWAAPGRQWILVEGAGYQTEADTARWTDGDHVAYYVSARAPKTTITANGRKPLKALGPLTVTSKHGISTTKRDYVFSAPAGDAVTIDVVTDLRLKRTAQGDPKAPGQQTLKLHRSDSYPAVIDPIVRGRR